jgi:Integrase core domain
MKIKQIVLHCDFCQRYKSSKFSVKSLNKIFDTPAEVGPDISIDIAGPMELQDTKYYMIVLADQYSRFVWATLQEKMPSTKEFSAKVLKSMEVTTNQISSVLSDNGQQFRGRQWENLCKQNAINKHLCSHCYLQSDGITEWAIQTIKKRIKSKNDFYN